MWKRQERKLYNSLNPGSTQGLNHKYCKGGVLVNITLVTHVWHNHLSSLTSILRKLARKQTIILYLGSVFSWEWHERLSVRYQVRLYKLYLTLDFLGIVWISMLSKLSAKKIDIIYSIILSNSERYHFRYKDKTMEPKHPQNTSLKIFS